MNSENFPVAMRDKDKEVASLVTTKPDEERAKELRDRLVAAHQPLLAILDEITAAGFVVSYQTQLVAGIPPRHQLANLTISKVLAS